LKSPDKGHGGTAFVAAVLFVSCQGSGERPDPEACGEDAAPGAPSSASPASAPELVFGGWLPVAREPSIDDCLTRAATSAADPETAIAILNEGLLVEPESAGLYEARGALYRAMGFLRAAERDLTQAVVVDPCRSATWYFLGVVRQELGLTSIALDAFTRAKELGLEGIELRVASARANRSIGLRAPAAADYAVALGLRAGAPEPDLLLEVLAFVEERGELSEALTVVDPAAGLGSHCLADRATFEVWSVALLDALRLELAGDAFERAMPEPTSVAGPTPLAPHP
jgi:tetratricopeptide (TPR) repeat protein